MNLRRVAMSLVAAALLTAMFVVADADIVGACSCAAEEPRTRIHSEDAAVIGTVVAVAGDDLIIELTEVAKGPFDVGDQLLVDTGDQSCATGSGVGGEIATFLWTRRDVWFTSVCHRTTAEDIRTAASSLPAAIDGPASTLVLGQFGPANTVLALARDGTIRGYGHSDEPEYEIAQCPGEEHFLTASSERITIRRTADLTPVGRAGDIARDADLFAVVCLSDDGRKLATLTRTQDERSHVTIFDDGSAAIAWSGPSSWPSLAVHQSSKTLFATSTTAVVVIDVETLDVETIEADVLLASVSVSTDGRRVAAIGISRIGGEPTGPTVVINLDTREVERIPADTGTQFGDHASLHWFDDGRLSIRPASGLIAAYAFDEQAERFSRIALAEHLPGKFASNTDTTIISVERGSVLETTFGVAGVRRVAELPSSAVYGLVSLRTEMQVVDAQPVNVPVEQTTERFVAPTTSAARILADAPLTPGVIVSNEGAESNTNHWWLPVALLAAALLGAFASWKAYPRVRRVGDRN